MQTQKDPAPSPVWTPDEHLDSFQVAGLLLYDPDTFAKTWAKIPGVPQPVMLSGDLIRWSPAQARDMLYSIPPGSETPGAFDWDEQELLDYAQCAALHSPSIKVDSFAGYVRRAANRIEQGLDTSFSPPQPELIRLGHPLFAPDRIGHYLRNRPGPGYFQRGADRTRGYHGGRKAGTIPLRVRRTVG